MITLVTPKKAQETIAEIMRDYRLEKGLTQKGLSTRSGVSLGSLRKFEQTGAISMESFFKLAVALGCIDEFIKAFKPSSQNFTSIDDVINSKEPKKRERGWRK